jgi:hypothetical protein
MGLIRKLLDYRWELRGHKVALVDLKGSNEIVIDKVRLMSFMKFAVNCMDKMRIEDIKKLRKQIAETKAKAKAKKIFKSELIKAKAKITKDIQNEKLFK